MGLQEVLLWYDLHRHQKRATSGGAERLIREIRSNTRKRISAEDKIRIVLEGFRKEIPVSDLCRDEGISTAIYFSWLKAFMEAAKARLKGDTLRSATEAEVKSLKEENARLKEVVQQQALRIQLLKKRSESVGEGWPAPWMRTRSWM